MNKEINKDYITECLNEHEIYNDKLANDLNDLFQELHEGEVNATPRLGGQSDLYSENIRLKSELVGAMHKLTKYEDFERCMRRRSEFYDKDGDYAKEVLRDIRESRRG